MLKKFFISCFILIFIFGNVYISESNAKTITLSQIVTTFNNSSIVKENATYGTIWIASCKDDKLRISITYDNTTVNLEYVLEGSILSANFSGDDAFTGLLVTTFLVDSIGQLHGYSEGDLLQTLNSDKISNYSVENEGIEVKQISEGVYQIKIDIDKKIPLINESNMYIEISDLQNLKEILSGEGSAEKTKGNIWFNKSGYNGKNTLLIAEKDELTENTYKSILSIIEVMFNTSKVPDYFESNYAGIFLGNKEFEGFKIEINPEKTEIEKRLIPSDSGYKFLRITIDKNVINSTIQGVIDKKNTNETKRQEDKKEDNTIKKKSSDGISIDNVKADNTQVSVKLPHAGTKNTIVFCILFIVFIWGIISCKNYSNYRDIK